MIGKYYFKRKSDGSICWINDFHKIQPLEALRDMLSFLYHCLNIHETVPYRKLIIRWGNDFQEFHGTQEEMMPLFVGAYAMLALNEKAYRQDYGDEDIAYSEDLKKLILPETLKNQIDQIIDDWPIPKQLIKGSRENLSKFLETCSKLPLMLALGFRDKDDLLAGLSLDHPDKTWEKSELQAALSISQEDRLPLKQVVSILM